jgi:hypothetical protein
MTKGVWVLLIAWIVVLATAAGQGQSSAQGSAQARRRAWRRLGPGLGPGLGAGLRPGRADQSVLRHVSQPAREDWRPGARHDVAVGHPRRRRNLGESHSQGPRRSDAAGRHAAPGAGVLDALVAHLETSIDKAAFASPHLRHSSIHRLNRSEYANAIRDLFALDVDVSALLPPDEEAYGFDNNATVLNISTSLMERYLSAAWKISSLAVASPTITPSLETFRVRGDLSQHDHVPGLPMGTRGGITIDHYFPVDGEYVISPRLYRETVNIVRGLELEHDLEVTLDGQRIVLARFGGPKDEQANYLQPSLAGDEWRSASEAPEDHRRTTHGRRRIPEERAPRRQWSCCSHST